MESQATTTQLLKTVQKDMDEMKNDFKEHDKADRATFEKLTQDMAKAHLKTETTLAVILEKLENIDKNMKVINTSVVRIDERSRQNEKGNEALFKQFNDVYTAFTDFKVTEGARLRDLAKEQQVKEARIWSLKEKMIVGFVATLCTIIGALAIAVLQRTEVINLSDGQIIPAPISEELQSSQRPYAKTQN